MRRQPSNILENPLDQTYRTVRSPAPMVISTRTDLASPSSIVWDSVRNSPTLAGAALDVYEHEPEVHEGLIGREDVVLAPHQIGRAHV